MKNAFSVILAAVLSLDSFAGQDEIRTGMLNWIDTVPVMDRPVDFGIPFLKGEVKKNDVIRLYASGGGDIASDSRPLAYWPDGSVKWMGVSAVVQGGTDNICFEAVRDRRKTAESAIKVRHLSDGFIIDTGKTSVFISSHGENLIDSILMCGRKVAGKASLICTSSDSYSFSAANTTNDRYKSKIQKVTLESQGNIRTVVKAEGLYSGKNGRSWLPFVVRMYFYAGCEQVKMVHTFVFDGDADKDFISSMGVRFEVPMREELYNRHVAFAMQDGDVWSESVKPLSGRRVLMLDGKTGWQERQVKGLRIPEYENFDAKNRHLIENWVAWNDFRLSQMTDNAFAIRKRTHDTRPWIGTFSEERASGYAFLGDVTGGLGVYMKDFWQSYPTSIQIDNATGDTAGITMWMWSPDSEPMDLRHYDYVAHDLEASYEDVQEGMSTPYGVARTHTFMLVPDTCYGGTDKVSMTARHLTNDAPLICTPEYLYSKKAFGIWSLPDTSAVNAARVENVLDTYLDYYVKSIEKYKWYGFWNYGDFMHTYDKARKVWKYDVGGYAWDNTELATNMWLWYSFLRTGRADVWKMAEAMTRHTSECDVYHLGPLAGLGSRHNVSHWGCGAKEARISQAAWNRFYYYLTGDERCGDLMSEVKDAEQMLYTVDPMRLALPRSQYPCTAPARLRIGPDWLAYAGNWFTEWERTENKDYRNKILKGMTTMAKLPAGLFTGPGVLGFDPSTGEISYEGDESVVNTNHLMTIMGGFQVMNEIMMSVDLPEWNRVWLEHAAQYKDKAMEISNNPFPVTRLKAYAAYKTGNEKWADEAWTELWNGVREGEPPVLSTNDAATWSLAAIYMLEVIPR